MTRVRQPLSASDLRTGQSRWNFGSCCPYATITEQDECRQGSFRGSHESTTTRRCRKGTREEDGRCEGCILRRACTLMADMTCTVPVPYLRHCTQLRSQREPFCRGLRLPGNDADAGLLHSTPVPWHEEANPQCSEFHESCPTWSGVRSAFSYLSIALD